MYRVDRARRGMEKLLLTVSVMFLRLVGCYSSSCLAAPLASRIAQFAVNKTFSATLYIKCAPDTNTHLTVEDASWVR